MYCYSAQQRRQLPGFVEMLKGRSFESVSRNSRHLGLDADSNYQRHSVPRSRKEATTALFRACKAATASRCAISFGTGDTMLT